jgi:hypothetical protein
LRFTDDVVGFDFPQFWGPVGSTNFLRSWERVNFARCARVAISTFLSIGVTSKTGGSRSTSGDYGDYSISPHGLKNASAWRGDDLMDTRIANRAIITIQVISWMAIITVLAMILTIIAASIYGSLGATH